jgi:hypothetical protein
MSEIHRWISGDGDPLLASSWQSAVAPGVAAQADLTFTATALNNETVTIAGIVYTFKTSINNGVAREVYHGVSATESAANLSAAINAGAGAGTLYSTATVSHVITAGQPDGVLGSNPSAGVMRATAYSFGTRANATAVSETSTVASWGSATLLGGLINWTSDAIVMFDGTSTVACLGTDRLDNIAFRLRQTEDAEHNIGSPTNPFRWNQTQYSYTPAEHILEGGGDVYLKNGLLPTSGYVIEFRVRRLDGPGYLEFQQNPGRLLVLSGKVGVKQTAGSSIDKIIVDGLDADVNVISGAMAFVWSRNGRFESQNGTTCSAVDGHWIVTGGVVVSRSTMASNSRIHVSGGVFRFIPTNAAQSFPGCFYVVQGGVLDLSESVHDILGRLLLLPPGEVWGALFQPAF